MNSNGVAPFKRAPIVESLGQKILLIANFSGGHASHLGCFSINYGLGKYCFFQSKKYCQFQISRENSTTLWNPNQRPNKGIVFRFSLDFALILILDFLNLVFLKFLSLCKSNPQLTEMCLANLGRLLECV